MIVQHNLMAINSHRQLGVNNNTLSKNLEKLSSGYRINKAADDAAGLAISEKMRAQITGLDRAALNAKDGASLIQTAEGALQEVHGMLNRMVELAVQSANGTIQSDDRQKIESEVTALKEEIDRISQATNFNGIQLLDGSLSGKSASGVVTGVKVDGLQTQAEYATKGTSQVQIQGAGVTANPLRDGDQLTLNVSFNDGTYKEVKLTVKTIDGSTQQALVHGDKEYKIDTKNAPSQEELTRIFNEVLMEDEEFAANFSSNWTDGATDVTYTSKKSGAEAQAITDVSLKATQADGKPRDNVFFDGTTVTSTGVAGTTHVKAEDSYEYASVDSMLKATKENGFFSVNGEKFAVFANSAERDAAIKDGTLTSDVHVFVKGDTVGGVGGGTNVAGETNAEAIAELIKSKTGLDIGTSAANNPTPPIVAAGPDTDVIQFKVDKEAAGAVKGTDGLTMQVGDTAADYNKITVNVDDMSSKGLGISNISMATQEAASASRKLIDAAIEKVSVNRGNLGALQNRLEHTISNLNVTSENMTAAESRIRDVDMAKEMMSFTKNNVLAQAAQAMLAQANQQPQQVLQLLR